MRARWGCDADAPRGRDALRQIIHDRLDRKKVGR